MTVDPQLTGARFQLGLLHFTSGNAFEAHLVWQPFDKLAENNPYRLFTTGMLHLASDEFQACVELLERGTSVCDTASVNKDMQRVIDRVRERIRPQQIQPTRDIRNDPHHVMLARYRPSPADEETWRHTSLAGYEQSRDRH